MNGTLPTLEQALAEVTKPGGEFPLIMREVGGISYRAIANTPQNLRDYYAFGAAMYADKTFIVYEDERYSFAQAMAEAASLAHALIGRLGVAKGDRVAIALRNFPEWIFAFMAVTSVGAVVVPMNAWWTTEEFDYGLADCGARVVFVDEERLRRIGPLKDKLGLDIIAIRTNGPLPQGVRAYREVVGEVGTQTMPEVPVDALDDASIFYTSGSTGHPKGALSTHLAMLSTMMLWTSATRARMLAMGLAGTEPAIQPSTLATVPFFHVTGSHSMLLMSYMFGRKLVLMYRWDPERALELIEKERITTLNGVPTMSWEILQSRNLERYDLSSLQDLGAGGAARPATHVAALKARLPQASPSAGYGLTETNAAGATNFGEDYLARPSSTGRPTPPLVEMKIVDEAGRTLPAGERGEILIKSITNIKGYWNKPRETKAAFTADGWLKTGDIGMFDADGFLYIVDRAKDIVIRGGENISCLEVEAVLYQHPDVFEASVFGLPDERLGEALAAVVVPKEGRRIDPEALKDHVRRHLAAFKVPERVMVKGEQLPRTASGKIFKRQIRADTIEALGLPPKAEGAA